LLIVKEGEDQSDVILCRQYKINITYNEKYHCPSMWLGGNNENNFPLTQAQIFEDIMPEYQNKTATFESHPHLQSGEKYLNIHACKHSEVMKTFIDRARENNTVLKPN